MTVAPPELSNVLDKLVTAFSEYHLPDSIKNEVIEDPVAERVSESKVHELIRGLGDNHDFVFVTLCQTIRLDHVKIRQNKFRYERVPLDIEALPGNRSKIEEVGFNFYKLPSSKKYKIYHRDSKSESKWDAYAKDRVSLEANLKALVENAEIFSAVVRLIKKAVRHIENKEHEVQVIVFIEGELELSRNQEAMLKDSLRFGFSSVEIADLQISAHEKDLWCVFAEMEEFGYYEGRPILRFDHKTEEASLYKFTHGKFIPVGEFSLSDVEDDLFAVLHVNSCSDIKLPHGHFEMNEEMLIKSNCMEQIYKTSLPEVFVKEFLEKLKVIDKELRVLSMQNNNKIVTIDSAKKLLVNVQALEVAVS
jgi:hypothetical protein